MIAVLMEYIRSLNQFQITVQVPSSQHLWSHVRGAGDCSSKITVSALTEMTLCTPQESAHLPQTK